MGSIEKTKGGRGGAGRGGQGTTIQEIREGFLREWLTTFHG